MDTNQVIIQVTMELTTMYIFGWFVYFYPNVITCNLVFIYWQISCVHQRLWDCCAVNKDGWNCSHVEQKLHLFFLYHPIIPRVNYSPCESAHPVAHACSSFVSWHFHLLAVAAVPSPAELSTKHISSLSCCCWEDYLLYMTDVSWYSWFAQSWHLLCQSSAFECKQPWM